MSGANLLFDAGFEGSTVGKAPRQTWHRVGSYLPEPTPWKTVDDEAFEGKRCLKTSKKGSVVLQREIWMPGGLYIFSAYLKAFRPEHRVRMWVRTYRYGYHQGEPFIVDKVDDRTVAVTTEWTRYAMPLNLPIIRNRHLVGPLDLGIESLDDGELWLDAIQFEPGDTPTPFLCNDPIYERLPDLRTPLYKPVEDPPQPDRSGPERPGCIPLKSMYPPEHIPRGWPMIGTVTLPEGQTYDVATWLLRSNDGKRLATQWRVLARWKRDGSIKAVQVISEYDGADGWMIEYGTKPDRPAWPDGIKTEVSDKRVQLRTPSLTIEIEKNGSCGLKIASLGGSETRFFTETVDGARFQSASSGAAAVRLEENGPARAVVRIEGDHKDKEERHLLSYVARVNLFRAQPLVRLEYTWINTNASSSTPVGAIGWHIPFGRLKAKRVVFAGADGRRHAIDLAGGPVSINQFNSEGRYVYEILSETGAIERFTGKAEGEMQIEFGDEILLLHICDWWQNHSLGIRVGAKDASIYFWPPWANAVDLSRGMSKTFLVDLWFGSKEQAPHAVKGPVQLVPPAEVYCRSGLFGGEILPQTGSPFPLFERISGSGPCLDRMLFSYRDKYDLYGQFNYGDTVGDGGWGNLESYLDHAMWLEYIRTGNPQFFEIAQAASRHYRDIDTSQISGSPIEHNLSHTLGGENTSHAWVQGILDQYILTGELRSLEVLILHVDFLKQLSSEKLTGGGRTVTRVLDTLADLYMLTGDDELIERYRQICAAQRENIRKGDSPVPGLFQSLSYRTMKRSDGVWTKEKKGEWVYPCGMESWYGLYSLVKMWLATGQEEWSQFLTEEIGYAMAPKVFAADRPEYFGDNPLTTDQRIIRCLAESLIGNRGCVLFPVLGYAYHITGDRRYLEIGMTAVYIAMISEQYKDPLYVLAGIFLEQARRAGLGEADERRYYQAAIEIMKGTAHPCLANPGFEDGLKGWIAWRYKGAGSYWDPIRQAYLNIDTSQKKEGRQSLHMIVRNPTQKLAGGEIPLESDDFLLEPGRTYRLTGWVKLQGEVRPIVLFNLRPLSVDAQPTSIEAHIGPPEADGWQQWRLEAKADIASVGRLMLILLRATRNSEGEAWFDGIIVE